MIVADGAAHGEAHERGAKGLSALAGNVDAQFLGDGAALVAADAKADIAAADERVEILGRHQVAGDLLHRELIEGLVLIERANQVIAIGPDVFAVVVMEAVSVGVARIVKPVAGALLAEGGPGEEPVNQVLVGLGRLVADEGLHLGGCG